MPLTEHVCTVCEKPYKRYTHANRPAPVVCGRECHYKRHSSNHKAPWLTELNTKRNAELSRATAEQRGNKLRGRGEGKGYTKRNGRHEHRLVAEQKLGRALLPGEIVHHENENKKDNADDNLTVLSSQAEHARLHALRRHHGK